MITLHEKDWPVLSAESPVVAKYIGDSICVGTRNGDIYNLIWKNGTYSQTRRVPVHTLQVLSISVPSDNSYVVTTAMDGKCVVCIPKDNTFVIQREIECSELLFPHACVSPTDRDLIAISGKEGSVIIEKDGIKVVQ